ncbi:MAG: glycosyltransferase family 4 protein [Ignavibacteria bacterium]|nr:glycosyltransferase family 4 protein [Ignavibacteria bacterium]
MKKVAILTTGHPPKDERIFHKIAGSLDKNSFKVTIICSTEDIDAKLEGIKCIGFDQKINSLNPISKIKRLINYLTQSEAEIIHACEPMTVLIGYVFRVTNRNNRKVRIFYDVTEWYPENIVKNSPLFFKPLKFLFGHILNFIVSNLCDAIILGENYKKQRYDLYAPKINKYLIGYYPILDYYKASTQAFDGTEIVFGYAGVISVSRGLKIMADALLQLKRQNPNMRIKFILAGRFEDEREKSILNELEVNRINIQYCPWTDYTEFSKHLEPTHICFDIRPANGIYERSLPIKIFDYMALGKCIVASNYKPISDTFADADCGILVNPLNVNIIVFSIESLITNPEKIVELGRNGRRAVEEFFNWGTCEAELLRAYNS